MVLRNWRTLGVAHGATLFSDAANKAIFRFQYCRTLYSSILGIKFMVGHCKNRLNYIEILVVFFYFTSFLFMLSLQLILAILTSVNFHTSTFDLVTIGIYTAQLLTLVFILQAIHIQYLVLRMILSLVTGVLVYFVSCICWVCWWSNWGFEWKKIFYCSR